MSVKDELELAWEMNRPAIKLLGITLALFLTIKGVEKIVEKAKDTRGALEVLDTNTSGCEDDVTQP